MSTPHNSAEKGDFAKTVLMPGDPLRAKFIADTFLQDVRQVTGVRGMLGFTGTYQGRPISVMGSGMGMPSIGIYSYELFKFYDVDNIIRIGSAGSYTEKAKLFDVVLSTGAVSESNYARVQSGFEGDITLPSQSLNRLTGWSPLIPSRFLVSRCTLDTAQAFLSEETSRLSVYPDFLPLPGKDNNFFRKEVLPHFQHLSLDSSPFAFPTPAQNHGPDSQARLPVHRFPDSYVM